MSSDDKPQDCVKFSTPISGFSAQGPVSTLLPGQTVDNNSATDISRYHYRRGKFYQLLAPIEFDKLHSVQQHDKSWIWTYGASVENAKFSFILSERDILQSIKLTQVTSEAQKQKRAHDYDISVDKTTITINGTEYFIDMNYPLHFNMDKKPDVWLNFGIIVIGQTTLSALIAGIAAQFGVNCFKDAFKEAFSELTEALVGPIWTMASAIMKSAFRFSMGFIRSMIGGLAVDDALAAAMTAAGNEWETALAKLDKKAICFSVAGTVILAAIILVIELVLHRSYQNVYVNNLTTYDMEFSFPYTDYGNSENLPSSAIPAAEEDVSDGFFEGWNYNGVAFDFISNSETHGLGYTMKIQLKDKNSGNVVKTMSALFEVPYSGDNSLYASVGDESDYKSYFNAHQGTQRVTQYSAKDNEHEIIVCYDYLSGKHENPATGNELYLYHSLVIIRDVDA
eukprot:TRINITY_DN834_c0_g1_i1.p2 TRINITY_DN834_c0_g1~~TRINITY_DN834_c0_g1_i1.p2  ORF type:complete len:452 (-),score=62.91 TRINITY_DN834_c0_g1_i1:524-1879(-)